MRTYCSHQCSPERVGVAVGAAANDDELAVGCFRHTNRLTMALLLGPCLSAGASNGAACAQAGARSATIIDGPGVPQCVRCASPKTYRPQ